MTTKAIECENCGEFELSAVERHHGMTECDACWRATLEHGHAHGMHDDDGSERDDDGVLLPVEDCPTCASLSTIARVAAALAAACIELEDRRIDVRDSMAFGGDVAAWQEEYDRVAARVARLTARLGAR